MKCPRCGSELSQDYRFCVHCGYKVENSAQNRPVNNPNSFVNHQNMSGNTQNAPKKKKGPWLWIVLGVLLFIVVAAIIIFVFLKLSDKRSDTDHKRFQTETEETEHTQTKTQDAQTEESLSTETESELTEASKSEESETAAPVAAIDMSCIRDIYASSMLSETDVTHSPDRLVDGDMATAWAEGAEGSGVRESVVFVFDDTYRVTGMRIASGYQKNAEVYANNNVPVSLKVIFSDGTFEVVKLENIMDFQKVEFSTPADTSSVTIEIEEVAGGRMWDDSVITEIEFY